MKIDKNNMPIRQSRGVELRLDVTCLIVLYFCSATTASMSLFIISCSCARLCNDRYVVIYVVDCLKRSLLGFKRRILNCPLISFFGIM